MKSNNPKLLSELKNVVAEEREFKNNTAGIDSISNTGTSSGGNEKDAKKEAPRGSKSGVSGSAKSVKAAFVLGAVAAMAVMVAVVFFSLYAVVGSFFGGHQLYRRNVSMVDLSGSDYQNFSGLSRMGKAETIVLTNTSFDDLKILHSCRSLKTVILKDKLLPAEDCIALYEAVPGAHVVCSVNIGGKVYDSGIEELKAVGTSQDDVHLLAALNRLKKLDLTDCTVSTETYDDLSARLPKCDISYMVEVNGVSYRNDVQRVELNGEITEQDVDKLKYFSALETVNAFNCTSADLVEKIRTQYPEIKVNRPIPFLDKTVESETELIDLRGSKYTLDQVKDALQATLEELPNLKKIDMCGCGLTNEEMEELCNEYPSIKFVWIIHCLKWDVRTDALAFSTLNINGDEHLNEKHYAPILKYCTDLIALDLGHSLIKDTSWIGEMKNLRAVIFTDNLIRDISAFSELKDLEFMEFNVNRVQSFEPLRDLKHLRYIDFWSSMDATDLSPLYNHDELELAIFHRTVVKEERERFMASNPNCDTYFMVDSEKVTTNNAWRTNPYRLHLKRVFKNWQTVVGYDESTGEFIFDENTDQYSIID